MTFQQLEESFESFERGTPRLNAIRDAIRQADEKQDLKWRFWFRYDHIEESIFCGDRLHALITFPEMLQLYDESPTLQEDGQIAHSLLICFRWIVEAVTEFPSISRAQIDDYFRLFRKRLLEQGHSLNIYHHKRALYYLNVDKGIAAREFARYLQTPFDSVSDGKAIGADFTAAYYLSIGEEEKALEAARPVFEGKLKASTLPMATYCDFLEYYLLEGLWEKARDIAERLEPRVKGDLYFLDSIGMLLSLWAHEDVPRGIALFNAHYDMYLASKNPWLRVRFATGTAHLFARIRDDALPLDDVRIPVNDPEPAALLASGDRAALSAWATAAAREQAAKFDDRNGSRYYMDLVDMLPT